MKWNERVRLPRLENAVSQDEEWLEVNDGQSWTRLRFHDYDAIYERPGLYEYLFHDLLKCQSPRKVVHLLEEVRNELGVERSKLNVLDLGAGNGIVGQTLREVGVGKVLGIDIIPQAQMAARRDRPRVYDDYLIEDMTQPTADTLGRLQQFGATALVCVAALGFGDIPPSAYRNTANLVPDGGLFAFNIKEDFLDARYRHGFAELIRRMIEEKVIRVEATRRYRHRLNVAGEPLYYVAIVASKLRSIPEQMIVES